MSLLIKMKPNFAVRNKMYLGDNYIIVANYDEDNEVCNFGYLTKKNKGIYRRRIGRWNIKYKNQNK